MKKDPAKQDSPPAAGRASDILPFRRSAILAERFLSYGNEVSYTIKKPRPCKGTRHLFVTSFHHPLQHTPAANQLCREICAPITPETDVAAYQIP